MSQNKHLFPHTRTRRGIGGTRSDIGFYVRSSWEANWCRYLAWLQKAKQIKEWAFEPETFEFPVKRGSRFYTPDFRVVKNDGAIEYHEIKGYMDPRSATKLKRMQKYYPKIKLRLIDKVAYRSIAKEFGKSLPYWESTRGAVCRND